MTTPSTRDGFAERWHEARYRDDLGATVELVIEAYSAGDPPAWLEEEHRRLWGHIASTLDSDPDDEDTDLGYLAVRLSSAREGDYQLALLGLASIGVQRAEQGQPVDPSTPDLLHSMLARYDEQPRDAHSDYVRRWRELAVPRIARLVRHDQERRVNEVRDRYVRAVGAADLPVVREILPRLSAAHGRLSPFAPILDDPGEQDVLFDDLRACEELMAAGRNALRQR